jgi:beta-lactamase superfamily II metal-dependent hydrolase
MKLNLTLALSACLALVCSPLNAASKDLTAWVIDVEGGQSTLFLTPSGETVLIDTGNPGDRDANRIMKVVKEAGVKQIDYLIITHFHGDHVGGVAALAAQIPIHTFIDHGTSVETTDAAKKTYADYLAIASKAKHIVAKPGDKLPVKGLDWTIVAAAGNAIEKPLPGAGKPNPACADFKPKDPDPTENAQSTGSVVTFGRFRLVDLGDLTWNKEQNLVCPVNKIGEAQVFIVSHHGLNISNSAALVNAIHPQVALMDNGEKKGGTIEALDTIKGSPGLVDLWQSHYSAVGGKEHNAADANIANLSADPDPANYLKLVAHKDGHFEVTNPRTGQTKKY